MASTYECNNFIAKTDVKIQRIYNYIHECIEFYKKLNDKNLVNFLYGGDVNLFFVHYSVPSNFDFMIHGGCVRDYFDEKQFSDIDIIFSDSCFSILFVLWLQKIKNHHVSVTEKNSPLFIERDFKEGRTNEHYATTILIHDFYGEDIFVDLSVANYSIFVLDFTVNGLAIDRNGNLISKSYIYSVDEIISHIKSKKLIFVDFTQEQNAFIQAKKKSDTGLFDFVVFDKNLNTNDILCKNIFCSEYYIKPFDCIVYRKRNFENEDSNNIVMSSDCKYIKSKYESRISNSLQIFKCEQLKRVNKMKQKGFEADL
jgi:hypothetical protein